MAICREKVVLGLVRALQLLALVAVVTLEYLADKKMGVMRYLVYTNSRYEEIFAHGLLVILIKAVLILLLASALGYWIYSLLNQKGQEVIGSTLAMVFFTGVLYLLIAFKGLLALKAYYLFLLACAVMLGLESLRLIANRLMRM